LAITPAASTPLPAHTTAVFDVRVSTQDPPACGAPMLFFQPAPLPPGFVAFTDPTLSRLQPGGELRFSFAVTATAEAAPGSYGLEFRVIDPEGQREAAGRVRYVLAPPGDCAVDPSRELMIRHPSVVDDPRPAWTFGHLMEEMAPSAADAPA